MFKVKFNSCHIGIIMHTYVLAQFLKLLDIVSQLISANLENLLVVIETCHSIIMSFHLQPHIIKLLLQLCVIRVRLSSRPLRSCTRRLNHISQPGIAVQLLIDPMLHRFNVLGDGFQVAQSGVVFFVDADDWIYDFLQDVSKIVLQ